MKRYRLRLSMQERAMLESLLSKGASAARKLTRARVMLMADQGEGGPGWSDAAIVEALSVGEATVQRVRKRAVEEGPEAALTDRPTSRKYERKLDGDAEAHLIAATRSSPPQGRGRWTLSLLADHLVKLELVESVCIETVRQTLKKTSCGRTCARAG